MTIAVTDVDEDGTRTGAVSWGAKSPANGRQFFRDRSLDRANGDGVDYYTFIIGARYELGLGVRDQSIDLDAALEDSDGNMIIQSWPPPGDASIEWLKTVIEPGTYYVRVAAMEDGQTGYYVRFGLRTPPASAPVFSSGAYSFSVAEDASVGDAVGTVTATDPDNDTLTYSITAGNGDGNFAIDGGTGAITVAAGLDYEITSSYSLKVLADDGNGNTASVVATITVTENVPPVFGSSSYSFSVAEDAAVGALVGSVSATDADNDTLTYSITAGNGDGNFAVNSSTGAITVAAGLDYETTSSYSLTAQADDGNGGTATATVAVTVTDVAEDADGSRAGAINLDADAATQNTQILKGYALDRANGDSVDYYTFTIDARYALGLGVRGQSIDLDVYVEDADGNIVARSWPPPVDATIEWLRTVLEPGTYYIRVAAGEDGQTDYYVRFGLKDPPTTPPAAPSGLEATAEGSVTLSWTVPEQPQGVTVRGVYVERGGADGSFDVSTQVTGPDSGAWTWTDTSVALGGQYSYRARVHTTAGEAHTDIVSVTVTRAQAPSADATLSALTLSGVDFGTFASSTTSYTADVANDVARTTVTAIVGDDGASYTVKAGRRHRRRRSGGPRGGSQRHHGRGGRRGRRDNQNVHRDGDPRRCSSAGVRQRHLRLFHRRGRGSGRLRWQRVGHRRRQRHPGLLHHCGQRRRQVRHQRQFRGRHRGRGVGL